MQGVLHVTRGHGSDRYTVAVGLSRILLRTVRDGGHDIAVLLLVLLVDLVHAIEAGRRTPHVRAWRTGMCRIPGSSRMARPSRRTLPMWRVGVRWAVRGER